MAESTRVLTPQELDKIAAEAQEIKARTARAAAAADAEIAKNQAEARKFEAEASASEYRAAMELIELDREQYKRSLELALDEYHQVYRFTGVVNEATVKPCISKLSAWHRTDSKSPVTLVINSPGGSILDGFALWDFLTEFKETHELTTVARGYAASMGGVLLQAGHKRIMGQTASLLIHEASFGAGGSMGDVEDTVEWVKKMQDRILEIFANRSNLTKAQIKRRWHRKDWWLTADESLKFSFVDDIGGGGVV